MARKRGRRGGRFNRIKDPVDIIITEQVYLDAKDRLTNVFDEERERMIRIVTIWEREVRDLRERDWLREGDEHRLKIRLYKSGESVVIGG